MEKFKTKKELELAIKQATATRALIELPNHSVIVRVQMPNGNTFDYPVENKANILEGIIADHADLKMLLDDINIDVAVV